MKWYIMLICCSWLGKYTHLPWSAVEGTSTDGDEGGDTMGYMYECKYKMLVAWDDNVVGC